LIIFIKNCKILTELPKNNCMNPKDFDIVIVAFSGGKDSLACLLHILDLGISRTKIELWHHDVDGRSETFFDWPCTESYCRAIANYFKIPIYFSWKDGGFKNELLRENEYSRKTFFETPEGLKTAGGDRGQRLTRRKFPHVGEIKKGRWCSAILKIGVAQIALCNQKRFQGKRTLFITGERAEESASRAKYKEWEEHQANSSKREITHWRPIHKWDESKIWQIIERWKINPHPAYRLGFGRVSCATCIFGNPNQWATVRYLFPEQFTEIAELEAEFGHTIHFSYDSQKNIVPDSVIKRSDRGTIYPSCLENPDWVAEAKDKNWNYSVVLHPWELPDGAFGDNTGPS